MNELTDQALKDQVNSLIVFFENITKSNLLELKNFYALDAGFKDPFNDVKGIQSIENMFESLRDPRFKVQEVASEGVHTFITWEFYFALDQMPSKGGMTIKGASHLIWAYEADVGAWRISNHRDYWDAAEEVYEKIPLLGALLRWVKKRASANL